LHPKDRKNKGGLDMNKRVSHFGIAVKNMDEALHTFTEVFGFPYPPAGVTDVPEIGVKAALIPIGDIYIELLESYRDTSPVAEYMKKHGEGLYHFALEVDDVEAEAKAMAAKGARLELIKPMGAVVNYTRAMLERESAHGVRVEILPKGTVKSSLDAQMKLRAAKKTKSK
jgi:methylmalonyl-CoA/ethylmalonyl-CoA epimerase